MVPPSPRWDIDTPHVDSITPIGTHSQLPEETVPWHTEDGEDDGDDEEEEPAGDLHRHSQHSGMEAARAMPYAISDRQGGGSGRLLPCLWRADTMPLSKALGTEQRRDCHLGLRLPDCRYCRWGTAAHTKATDSCASNGNNAMRHP